MLVVFFRHAKAEKKKLFQNQAEDFNRGLHPKGKAQTLKVLRAHRRLFSAMKVLYTSPLVRAVQTAELIYAEYAHLSFELLPELDKLSDPASLVELMATLPEENCIFVGHEPHLSSVLSLLLGRKHEKIKKSGFVVIELKRRRPKAASFLKKVQIEAREVADDFSLERIQ